MSESVYMRQVVDALMPEGSILTPAAGGYLDRLLDGIADNEQAILEAMESLANIRNPWKCAIELLPDLEREFGITPNPALTEKDRRANLALVRYKRRSLGTVAKLQRALDRAGFGAGGYGLIVTPNASPATDPAPIVDNSYQLTAHAIGDESGAVAGNMGAYAARRGGYYLVNGDSYAARPEYPQAGQICARAFDGTDTLSGKECAGHYTGYALYENEYASPGAALWPLVFFVGGIVARNADGSIAAVSPVTIPATRRQELHRLILRIKPMGIWAAMIIQYT
ncbi:MAG: phage tail protein [Spirochaetes bacterium]|nr:phage tail protein [Spirochaetota bacterium]